MSPRFNARLAAAIAVLTAAAGVAPSTVWAGTAGVAALTAPPTSATTSEAVEPDPATIAAEQAARSGTQVEVSGATTPLDRTLANPDGTFTLEVAAAPQRTLDDGQWVPIDTTLVPTPDGMLAPRHAAAGIEFSGGGSGTAIAFTTGSVTMRWSWSSDLPTPTVQDDTAIYADVLPGVDLRLTASAESFSEVLVVKDRGAADRLVTDPPHFTLDLDGGTVQLNGDGTYGVLDEAGVPVAASLKALMWDSSAASSLTSGRIDEADPTAIPGPDEGSRVAAMRLSLVNDKLTLSPDPVAVSSPQWTYPLYLDPTTYQSPGANKWTMIDAYHPTTSYYKWGSTDEGMGFQNFSGTSKKRLLWAFDLGSRISGASITSATLYARETWAGSCTQAGVQVLQVGDFSSGTNWGNQPGWVGGFLDEDKVSFGRDGCATKRDAQNRVVVQAGDANVELGVTPYVAALAGQSSAIALLELKASDETTSTGWKRFARSGTVLGVTYNRAPALVTSQLRDTSGACATTATAARRVSETVFDLTAGWSDSDKDRLTTRFVAHNTVTKINTPIDAAPVTATPTATTHVTTPPLTNNTTYVWSVTTNDGTVSTTSPSCYFTVDVTEPTPPRVYAQSGIDLNAIPAGLPMTWSFMAGVNSPDNVKFAWAINSDTPMQSATVAPGATFSAPIRFSSAGMNRLTVWGYDSAGNMTSSPWSRSFQVVGFTPSRWTLDSSTLQSGSTTVRTTDFDAQCQAKQTSTTGTTWAQSPTPIKFTNPPVSLAAGMPDPSGFNAVGDQSMRFNGNGVAWTTGGAPLDASAAETVGYTATAWVAVSDAAVTEPVDGTTPPTLNEVPSRTLLAIDSPTGAAMNVGLVSRTGAAGGTARFRATVFPKAGGSPLVLDLDSVNVRAGWWQIAVVVAPESRTASVSAVLNGVENVVSQSWTSAFVPATPSGTMRLGSARPADGSTTASSPWLGNVDEVRLFRAALINDLDAAGTSTSLENLSTWMNKVRFGPDEDRESQPDTTCD